MRLLKCKKIMNRQRKIFLLLVLFVLSFTFSLLPQSNVLAAEKETIYISTGNFGRRYYVNSNTYDTFYCSGFPCQIIGPNGNQSEQRTFSGFRWNSPTPAIQNPGRTYWKLRISFTVDLGDYVPYNYEAWQTGQMPTVVIGSAGYTFDENYCVTNIEADKTHWWSCYLKGKGNIPEFALRWGDVDSLQPNFYDPPNYRARGINIITPNYEYEFYNSEEYGAITDQTQIMQDQWNQDQQDRSNIQSTSDNAENAGNNATSNASTGSQTLMQAFSSLVSALYNVRETNCNLPNFNINGLQFENLNMCTYSVPPQLMALFSIGLVFVIVPLGINIVKRILKLYNELVGGK